MLAVTRPRCGRSTARSTRRCCATSRSSSVPTTPRTWPARRGRRRSGTSTASAGGADGFRGWLTTIGRNRALDHLRRSQRRPAPTWSWTTSWTGPPTRTWSHGRGRLGTEAALARVAGLPVDQAEAIMLRTVLGFDAPTAARILGKRPGAVRSATHRGLRASPGARPERRRASKNFSSGPVTLRRSSTLRVRDEHPRPVPPRRRPHPRCAGRVRPPGRSRAGGAAALRVPAASCSARTRRSPRSVPPVSSSCPPREGAAPRVPHGRAGGRHGHRARRGPDLGRLRAGRDRSTPRPAGPGVRPGPGAAEPRRRAPRQPPPRARRAGTETPPRSRRPPGARRPGPAPGTPPPVPRAHLASGHRPPRSRASRASARRSRPVTGRTRPRRSRAPPSPRWSPRPAARTPSRPTASTSSVRRRHRPAQPPGRPRRPPASRRQAHPASAGQPATVPSATAHRSAARPAPTHARRAALHRPALRRGPARSPGRH